MCNCKTKFFHSNPFNDFINVDGKIKELDNKEAEQILSDGIIPELYSIQNNSREHERRVVNQMINDARSQSNDQDNTSGPNNLPESKGWWNI